MRKTINNGRIWNNGIFGVDRKQMQVVDEKQKIYLKWSKYLYLEI